MKTILAVLAGVVVTTLLIFTGYWIASDFLDATFGPGSSTRPGQAFMLVWTFGSIAAGAYVAVRILPVGQVLNAFVIAQLFFGFGMLSAFWHEATMFNFLALLLAIPAAIIGSWAAGLNTEKETSCLTPQKLS